jgi:hypothetical protein
MHCEHSVHVRERITELEDKVKELEERVDEDNAVCLCGCPASDHEQFGEDGEQCEHEDHVCQRVAPSVRDLFVEMRRERDEAQEQLREAQEERNFLKKEVAGMWHHFYQGGEPPTIEKIQDLASTHVALAELQAQHDVMAQQWTKVLNERDEALAMVKELRRDHMTGEELRAILLHKDKPKPGTPCFFCGEPVTGTTHFDRWHSKTRRRLPSVYVCDECFDKHPKIPEA